MSIRGIIGIIIIVLGIAMAVNAYSTAAVTNGLNVSVVDPAEALLAYERYPVTLVAGETVTTTIPIKLHNRLPDGVEIESLSVTSHPHIQVHSFEPDEILASEEAFLRLTYVADAVGGEHPVSHHIVASSSEITVELVVDIDFTVLNKLVVSATPEDGGVVQGAGTYRHGTTATIDATPNTCYVFDHWDGDVPASQRNDNPASLTMDTNKEIEGVFTRQQYELTVDATDGGSVEPSGTNTYDCGSEVTLIAKAHEGYQFAGWDGAVDGGAQTSITIEDDTRVKALFTPIDGETNIEIEDTQAD